MQYTTPRGFRDVLPQEAALRETVSTDIAWAMSAWGYVPVETPIVEFAEVACSLDGGKSGFRLFDSDGEILVLRPDMTVPLARVIATRMRDMEGPLRLRYVGPVFREEASLSGRSREFTQLGVELVGAGGALADAEVLGVLLDALDASGLSDAIVSVGTVAALSAALDATGMDGGWRQSVLSSIHGDDLVGLDALLADPALDADLATSIRRMVRLRGGLEAVDECRRLLMGTGAQAALDELAEAIDILSTSYDVESRIRVDFSLLRSFDYYTGLVFEVFAPGRALSLGGGGRYDDALATWGRPAAAAGFGLSLEAIVAALDPAISRAVDTSAEVVTGGEARMRFARAADERRSSDVAVTLDLDAGVAR